MTSRSKYLALFLAALTLAGCEAPLDDFMLELEEEDQKNTAQEEKRELDVVRVLLEDGGSTLNVDVDVISDLGGARISDPDSVKIRATEFIADGKPYPEASQPVFRSVSRSGAEALAAKGVSMNVLVDLALPQSLVDMEQTAVIQLRSLFSPGNLSISFMDNTGIRETVPATDYVIRTYFKASPGKGKMLYRSVLERIDSLSLDLSPHKILTVFSDGKIYERNSPIDPKHFKIQAELTAKCSADTEGLSIYYASFLSPDGMNEAGNFMKSLCDATSGLSQNSFDWPSFNGFLVDSYGIDHVDYRFTFSNPARKIYNGRKRILLVECLSGETVIASGRTQYSAGSFYRPVVAQGKSAGQVLFQGIIIAFIIAILVYILLQLLIPFVSNIIFKKKYVTTFKRENMTVGNILVGKECYYCKAPFVEGDEIVARCKHVMHKSCWDENGYHCPEYSRNCKDGSHYYNPHNLFDPGNATYHLKWMLGAVFSGLFAWIIFFVNNSTFSVGIIEKVMFAINKITPGSPEAATFYDEHIAGLNQLPSFGLYIGFALACALSAMTVHRKGWLRSVADVLARGIAGGIVGYACFLAGSVLGIVLDLGDKAYVLDWVPWALTGYLVVLISTFGTRIRMNKTFIIGAIIIGVISMLVWDVIFVGRGIDYRVLLLLSHICFTTGIALSVAEASPRSERYYFHVGGAMKEMDIAIYKWFEANSNRVVTIGRSVDCDLVMSWDMAGDIAPVQARLTKKGLHVYITPLEDGVCIKKKNLPVNKAKCLYHGTRFVIGKTEFIYQEKDI